MSRKVDPKICPRCNKVQIRFTRNVCHNCYRNFVWKRKKIICKRCKREMFEKAKGLCGGCYNTVFMLDYNKAWNHKKRHNINLEIYKEITKKCIICGFDKIVDLHHLDENKKNNSRDNLIGLCPNHHKMFHDIRYRKEMIKQLEEKGFNIPESEKWNFKLNDA